MKQVLQSLIDTCTHDQALYEPAQLRQRIDMLDQLEEALMEVAPAPLQHRARQLYDELDGINRVIYADIRAAIRQGDGAERLRQWLPAPLFDAVSSDHAEENYDYLDTLVSGVLQFDEPGDDIAVLAPEMVFYQPTPARLAFDLIDRLALAENDVLMDLGSGLGHVPLLTAICSKARCIGVELEAAYAACAARCAAALKLSGVHFVAEDVRETDLSAGTVFYLYTPFTGSLLRGVLDRLAEAAATRRIRICTLGPCSSVVAGEPWLRPIGTSCADRVCLFESR